VTAHNHPHRLSGVPLAPYARRPGETHADVIARRSADAAQWRKEQDAERERLAEFRSADAWENTDLACGVGTFDGNGQPRGAGWW
jgi:hypothetical protein